MDEERERIYSRWCEDCKHKGLSWLSDPCHDCFEDSQTECLYVPKYYEEERRYRP